MAKSKLPLEKALGRKAFAAIAADPAAFVRAFDPRPPWDFQTDIMREVAERGPDGRFARPIAVLSFPRQNSKTTLSGWLGAWAFFTLPGVEQILTIALDTEGAQLILRDVRRLIRGSRVLSSIIDPQWGLTRSEIRLVDGRSWRVKSSDAVRTRGLRPDVILYDEAGWSPPDSTMFETVTAGQAAAPNPLLVITSTVSPAQFGVLWDLFQRSAGGDESIRLIYRQDNPSPRINPAFLERQRGLLPPSVYAREHENAWGSGTDAFCTEDDWRRAIGDGDPTLSEFGGPAVCFLDVGLVHDELSISAGRRAPDGKAELIHLEGRRGSRSAPVDMGGVEDRLLWLKEQLGISTLEIESPQGVYLGQRLQGEGWDVRILHPTAQSNASRWSSLYLGLRSGHVRLPNDPVLRRQLLSLVVRSGPAGLKVEDVPSIHNDRAVAVAGVVHLLGGHDDVPAGAFEKANEGARRPSRWISGDWRDMASIKTRYTRYHRTDGTVTERTSDEEAGGWVSSAGESRFGGQSKSRWRP